MTERLHSQWLSGPTSGAAPVVLLHGFTQNAAAWGPFAEHLGLERPVLAVDLPGHGGSDSVRADLPGAADLVADLLDTLGAPATVLGYSMGGRVALHLALQRPALLSSLVLVSTTAGIDDTGERAARRADDERLADRIEEIGVDAFLDEWLAQPLFASLSPEAACRDARRNNTAAGLASSLRSCGAGTQEPLWDRLGSIDVPVLVVVGERDAKFAAIGRRLVASIGGNARLEVIADTGHNAPLECPERTAATILT